MKHRITADMYYNRGMKLIDEYDINPPLPYDDPFSYVIREFDFDYESGEGWVVTGKPHIAEATVVFDVPLETAVFTQRIVEDRWVMTPLNQLPSPTKKIRVTAVVEALHYGGSLFTYSGIIDRNPPDKLPIKVLEWKISFQHGMLRYESGRDAQRRIVMYEIGSAPSARAVCAAEGKPWPQEPNPSINLMRFFFQRWLKDRSLTLDSVQPLYEDEVLNLKPGKAKGKKK